jgi:hypothetical protein
MEMWDSHVADPHRMPVKGEELMIVEIENPVYIARRGRPILKAARVPRTENHCVFEVNPQMQERTPVRTSQQDDTRGNCSTRHHAKSVWDTMSPATI